MTAKLLVITGGSKGIGRAVIERFLNDGFAVINISRSPCSVEGVVNLALDMSDIRWEEKGGALVHSAVSAALPTGSGQVVLVHNAAIMHKDSVDAIEAKDFSRVLQLNVVAPSQLNQLILPAMAPGSAIVYVGSTLSEKAVANTCSYVTSKHALVGLMRATCQDLAGRGIHTNCVCPGFTDTEMLRAHVGGDQSILDSIASGVTFNRLIESQEMAAAIYAAATQPVFNGAVIHANLGQIER
ncbi:SDR family NAD(P)-dependent oxidoreductase [Simiduia aestuariiviva]|uniref:NAD(P)-dependent dehydrogenase (Short-subunit alcohol dehydrogenase family) n=1 Tax=Simiduia aestuariiviva TaxID=1510459 RepID=A0A839UMY6_9GAMM|nr:NAD(P)-dependent dehydrogenase (short-subunit alcohol dehydrogenase family) [Simiduia aestuariiviva]